jgi:hypothetical protein
VRDAQRRGNPHPVAHGQWRMDDIEIPLHRAVTIVLTDGLDGNLRTSTLHI